MSAVDESRGIAASKSKGKGKGHKGKAEAIRRRAGELSERSGHAIAHTHACTCILYMLSLIHI